MDGASGSVSGRLGLSDADRRQLLYLDAVRAGLDPGVPPPWRVDWATGTDLDPRLELKLHVGPVTAVAFGVVEQRPWVAVGVEERGSPARLLVGDLLSGQLRELPCDEPVRSLSFATMSADHALVSGHEGGRLRLWGAADGTLRKTWEAGDHDVEKLDVVESGREAWAVTRDANCRVRCFSLPSGEPVEVPGTGHACAMCAGRLSDGRAVVLLGDDGLSLWEIASGRSSSLPVPSECLRLRSVALSRVDGRDCATMMDEAHRIATIDLSAGAQIAPAITAHMAAHPDAVMEIASLRGPHPPLAVMAGRLAVPTRWRVHLWNLGTSQQDVSPIAGTVAGCLVQAVRWQDRDHLVTASPRDGVVALWDLDQPLVRALGHEQRVSRVVVAKPDGIVVSADEGGTIVARHAGDGHVLAQPLATGVESTRALAAWREGDDIIAAQGAGARHASDSNLRRWNLTTGEPYGPPIDAHPNVVHWLSRIALPGGDALVSYGPDGMLKIWRPHDGVLLAETLTNVESKLTGFATGIVEGRPLAVLTSYSQPMAVYTLDDLAAPPTVISTAGDDVALAIAGPHIVAAHSRTAPRTVRVWHLSGQRIGPGIPGDAEITTLAPRTWPAAFIGRADATVSLTDLHTGHDLCPRMLLPTVPSTMTVTADGDLIVGFGSDLARVRPPG
ncbi:WD40 repeat domain-containing protein [Allorhizocola rhizosphaerae]|uniref:WD40 repeat domain-containing protein n=1 Tax=Allorhizocola rhizosphaerae TaxID=1872709 RepID=UPI001B8D8CD6|nr:hypothetical protein [Allorhizocola rhizosphaerae]